MNHRALRASLLATVSVFAACGAPASTSGDLGGARDGGGDLPGDLASAADGGGAITLVTALSARTADPASTITLPLAAHPEIAAGDLLLLALYTDFADVSHAVSGWTPAYADPTRAVFTRAAAASEPDLVIPLSTNFASSHANAALAVYRGVDASVPFDGTTALQVSNGAVNNVDIVFSPTVSAAHAGDRAVVAFMWPSGHGKTWTGAGPTALVTPDQEVAIFDQTVASPPSAMFTAHATFDIFGDSTTTDAWTAALRPK